MASFKDLFTSINTPYQCTVVEMNPKINTKYGEKAFVKFVCDGVEYDWFAAPASFARNIVSNGINVTDTVEIMQVPSSGSYPSYQFRKTGAGAGAPAGSGSSTMTVDRNKANELKDNKIAYQGIVQALITSGKYGIEECKKLTDELVDWIFERAEAKYEADHDEHADVAAMENL